MSNFLSIKLDCEPCKGANITECTIEAIRLCAAERRDVQFSFNDTMYVVTVSALMSALKKSEE